MFSGLRRGVSSLGFAVAFGLAACGGGGSGTTPPPADAPTVALQIQPIKVFRFTWTDVSDATEYRLQEDADSVSGYTQVATIATGVGRYDLVVSLPRRVNARYKLQACNAGGCTDSAPVAVSGSLAAAVGYFKASNTQAWDYFGAVLGFFSVPIALSDDGLTLAVGATGESSAASGIDGNQADESAPSSGAVYVFARSGATWVQQAYIKASNPGANDLFGANVALSADGSTLAVGAHREASDATGIDGVQNNNLAPDSGAVYVYTRSGATWSQQAYVKASNAAAGDVFGSSLALSGDGSALAVGAPGESSRATGVGGNQSDNSAALSGAVYVFGRNGTAWSQQAYVKASNTRTFSYFGNSVALSRDGGTLAVGARGDSSSATGIDGNQADSSAPFSGAVHVFVRSGTTWLQQAYVKASNTDRLDQFGGLVALSADGNTLSVAAHYEASGAFGVNGDQGDNSAASSGAVYVFARSDTSWAQQAYLKAGNATAGDVFGWAMTLSSDGNTLAVGAPFEAGSGTGLSGDPADNSMPQGGAVYLYTRHGAAWMQQAYVKASNTNLGTSFGSALALSADGSTLAVGAFGERSGATGIGGNQLDGSAAYSGAVYLY